MATRFFEESSSSSSRWHAQVGKCWNGNRDCLPFSFLVILLIDTIDIYRLYRFYMIFYRFYMIFYRCFDVDLTLDVKNLQVMCSLRDGPADCEVDVGSWGYSQISPFSSWISHWKYGDFNWFYVIFQSYVGNGWWFIDDHLLGGLEPWNFMTFHILYWE